MSSNLNPSLESAASKEDGNEVAPSSISKTEEESKAKAVSTGSCEATTAPPTNAASTAMSSASSETNMERPTSSAAVSQTSSTAASSSSLPSVDEKPPPTTKEASLSSNAESETSEAQAKEQVARVDEGLREFDILTGRGSGPNQSHGNTRFRQLVWETYQEHLAAGGAVSSGRAARGSHFQPNLCMDSGIKNKLAGKIYAKIQDLNGRFLRRISPEDYRNLPEAEREQVIQVQEAVAPRAKRKSSDATAESDGKDASTRKRLTFYVKLSTKETMEKIKQSLRFQVDRSEQQKEQKLHRDQLQQNAISDTLRKRKATDEALLQSIMGGLNSPGPAAKRLATSLGLRSNLPMGLQLQPASFVPGLSTSDATAAMKAGQAELLGKLLQEGGAAASGQQQQRQPLTGFPSDVATMDFSTWPPATARARAASLDLGSLQRTVGSGTVLDAATKLQTLQQEQQLSVDALAALRTQNNSAPTSDPTTPSSFRNNTQLEALSRLLLQEQLNAGAAAQRRQDQEMNAAASLLGSSPFLSSTGGNAASAVPTLSMAPSPELLQALLARNTTSKRQSLPETPVFKRSASDGPIAPPVYNAQNQDMATLLARLQQNQGNHQQQLPPSLLAFAKQAANDSHQQQGK